MKRLLITTTALAVALSGINPAGMQARAETQMVCPPEAGPNCAPEDMVPKKKKKKAAEQQQGTEEQAPKKKKKADPAADGSQQPAAEPQKKKKKAEAAVNDAEQPAAEPQKKKKKAQPEAAQDQTNAEAPKPPVAEPVADPAPVVGGDATDPAADPAAPKGKKKQGNLDPAEAAPSDPIPAADDATAEPVKKRKKGELPEIKPSEGVAMPPEQAVEALDEIVSEDAVVSKRKGADGKTPRTPKPEAAELDLTAPAKDARIERRKILAEERRKSSEDFKSAPDADRQEEAKKHGGLSDLEKAGLVVLGALVVGALLNNGNRVVSNTGDRVVVDRGDGQYMLYKDDDALIRYPGSDVQTETFNDGSTRTTVYRTDGSSIVTIRDASGRVLRRALVYPDGRQTLLINDLDERIEPVNVATLPRPRPGGLVISTSDQDAELRAEMYGMQAGQTGRSYSLQQIREYAELRALAPTFDVENIAFPSGSAAIQPGEAQKLSKLGKLMGDMIARNPAEMFLIEGHTDAVGDAAYNLALSDRRAESLALALTEYFGVPPENMVVQGYGEAELLVPTQGDEPRNRRALVRMISPLLQQQ